MACRLASLRMARHITSTSTVLQVGNASQTPATPHREEKPHRKPPISTSLPPVSREAMRARLMAWK
ncbi:hypothetical protein D3C85_1739960 [compost metagenome]